jgi:hypothetical protein
VRRHLDLRLGGLLTTLRHSRLYVGVGYRALGRVAAQYDLDLQAGESHRSLCATLRGEVPTPWPLVATCRIEGRQQRYGARDVIVPRGGPSASLRLQRWASTWTVELPVGHHGVWRHGLTYARNRDCLTSFDNARALSYIDRANYRLLTAGSELRWGTMAAGPYADVGYDTWLHVRRRRLTDGAGWWTLGVGGSGYHPVSARWRLGVHARATWSTLPASLSPLRTWLLSPAYRQPGQEAFRCYTALRARSFVAPGVSVVRRWGQRGQVRLDATGFLPVGSRGGAVPWQAADGRRLAVGMADLSWVWRTAAADCVAFLHAARTDRTLWAVGFRIGFLPRTGSGDD